MRLGLEKIMLAILIVATSSLVFPGMHSICHRLAEVPLSASIIDRALRSLFVFDGPVHGLDRGLHLQEPLTGLFGLAALVRTGEHFNKRSPLLDQSRSRLFEIVGVLFAHNCLSRPIPGSALGRNDSLSRRRQADDRAQIRYYLSLNFPAVVEWTAIGHIGFGGGLRLARREWSRRQ